MKHALIAVMLIVTSLHAAEPKAEPKDSFPEFTRLSKREAANTARKQAGVDFTSGHYRILVFGLRASVEDKRFAKEGVEVKAIAGCIVSEGILEGARVYNEVMREKLKAKLGRDIFDENNNHESKK